MSVRLVPYHRVSRVAGTPMERTTDGWRALSLRAYVVSARGVPFDGRISPLCLLGAEREHVYVTIPLDGEYVSLREPHARLVGVSEALVEHTIDWNERWERDMRALVVQWHPAAHGMPSAGLVHLSPRDLAHARELSEHICARSEQDPWPLLAAFLERLRALGIGMASPRAIDLPAVPTDVVRVEHAMSELLMQLDRGPASVDLARMTGLSERHLRRVFRQHHAWLGSFRERVRHARLPSAANWLAFSRLPTERIARSLGYGSGRALLRALQDAGYEERDALVRRAR